MHITIVPFFSEITYARVRLPIAARYLTELGGLGLTRSEGLSQNGVYTREWEIRMNDY